MLASGFEFGSATTGLVTAGSAPVVFYKFRRLSSMAAVAVSRIAGSA